MPNIKIFHHEYPIPNIDNQQLSRLEHDIQNARLRLQDTDEQPPPKPVPTPPAVRPVKPWWKPWQRQAKTPVKAPAPTPVAVSKPAPTFQSIDKRFQELDSIVTNYDQLIQLLQQHRDDYIQFFDRVSADVCLVIEDKALRTYALEQERIQKFANSRHPQTAAIYQQQHAQIWNMVRKLCDAAVLALKKLDLFKSALQELADNHEQQKIVLVELLRDAQDIRDAYDLQKKINSLEAEVNEMLTHSLNLEKLLEPYLGPFGHIIETITRTDSKITGAVRDIQALTQNILSDGLLMQDSDTEEKILDFLAHAEFSEHVVNYLAEWDLNAIPPSDFVMQTPMEADIGQALDNLQQFIKLRFPQALRGLYPALDEAIDGDVWLEQARERVAESKKPIEPLSCFQDVLSSGNSAPEMVVMPQGHFQMGSAYDHYEQPEHEVQIEYQFALARYPVTFAEYDLYCASTGKAKPNVGKNPTWRRAQCPVVQVSWQDAVNYCYWLSEQTGREYRLPSEAEWEYACLAGSTLAYCFGDDALDLGRYAWFEETAENHPHIVGQKQANAWGLYDMHGNVWEWCQDRWHESYEGAPENGLAWESGTGHSRLLRGGAWNHSANDCRASFRGYSFDGDNSFGFRVACLLPQKK